MSKILDYLNTLSSYNYLSGKEACRDGLIPEPFCSLGATRDASGNLILQKPSGKKNAKTILIEAHLDAIGLCVNKITPKGFISVSACGGFDASILPSTEFIIHGKKPCKAVAASIPPHLRKLSEKEKELTIDGIYLDCGFRSKKEAEEFISIGDAISFAAPALPLVNGKICAPSLDNKASVIALLLAFEKVSSDHDLIFLFSLGEETTSRSIKELTFEKTPEFAIVVDVGFAMAKDLNPDRCIHMNKGPSISLTDTLSRDLSAWVLETAKKENLDLQIVCEPGGTGTSATHLQLRDGGIPCACLSIPLKFMHTCSEIVSERDVEATAKLICALAAQKQIPAREVILVES